MQKAVRKYLKALKRATLTRPPRCLPRWLGPVAVFGPTSGACVHDQGCQRIERQPAHVHDVLVSAEGHMGRSPTISTTGS